MNTVHVLRGPRADTEYGIGYMLDSEHDGRMVPVMFTDDLGEPGVFALVVAEGEGVENRYSGYRYWVEGGRWEEQHMSLPQPDGIEFPRELDWSWAEEVRLND